MVDRLTQLVTSTVETIEYEDAALTIALGGGVEIVVDSADMYEAWQVNGSDGTLLVCMPGGGLSWWLPKTTQ